MPKSEFSSEICRYIGGNQCLQPAQEPDEHPPQEHEPPPWEWPPAEDSEPPPMLNVLMRRCVFLHLHLGQGGLGALDERSRSSNRCSQRGHSNSKIGIALSQNRLTTTPSPSTAPKSVFSVESPAADVLRRGADPADIIDAWPQLPDAIRGVIIAFLRTVFKGKGRSVNDAAWNSGNDSPGCRRLRVPRRHSGRVWCERISRPGSAATVAVGAAAAR